jgi:predicted nuclease of predicted toxin-antitoxin system
VRVVLDEGVPRQLADALRALGLDADRFRTDWKGISNGVLIRAVEAAGYTVLVTNDKNIVDQQSLTGRCLAIVALPLNRRSAVMARVPDIADTIRRSQPGQHVAITLGGRRLVTRIVAGQAVEEDWPRVPPFDL